MDDAVRHGWLRPFLWLSVVVLAIAFVYYLVVGRTVAFRVDTLQSDRAWGWFVIADQSGALVPVVKLVPQMDMPIFVNRFPSDIYNTIALPGDIEFCKVYGADRYGVVFVHESEFATGHPRFGRVLWLSMDQVRQSQRSGKLIVKRIEDLPELDLSLVHSVDQNSTRAIQ